MNLIGHTPDGQPVHRITIGSEELTASFLTLGATLQEVRLAGLDRNLTTGSDRIEDYFETMTYHGAVVGPVANRIGFATVELDGKTLSFPQNQAPHTLHSGDAGTHHKIWEVTETGPSHVLFRIDLPDGEGGFPGDRTITARFTVKGASLRMELRGATDKPTFMNVVNHSYWNLDGKPTWAGHTLQIAAEAYLPISDELIPSGEVRDVAGGGFDFRQPRKAPFDNPLIDHNFVLSRGPVALREVLWFTGSDGTKLTISTTEPGIQVYDGGQGARRGGALYEAPAFEAQGWPDAMHHPEFPSTRLNPGEVYATTTVWSFSRG